MKKTAILFSLVILLSFSGYAIAQQKAKTSIATVKEQGQMVNFTLTSSKPFIFGNNRYILHIGDKEIYRNKQSAKNGIGTMTFLIPENDFDALQEGADVYLTYGKVSTENKDIDAMNKADFVPFWSLGKFSKTLLTK